MLTWDLWLSLQWWKSYTVRKWVFATLILLCCHFRCARAFYQTVVAVVQYTRDMRTQTLSPFEYDVIGPLFRNMGHKIQHKIEVRATGGAFMPLESACVHTKADRMLVTRRTTRGTYSPSYCFGLAWFPSSNGSANRSFCTTATRS
jgi:hypothetical protein